MNSRVGQAHPATTDLGYVYELQDPAFSQLVRPDGHCGLWAIPEAAMPLVYDAISLKETPGISVKAPHLRLIFRAFVIANSITVCRLSAEVEKDTYLRQAREAGRLGYKDAFFKDAMRQGWLTDMTHEFYT